jgi:anti-sigma factor RsiW
MEPINPHSLRRDLSAFADGELDPAAAERLERHLADDRAAAEHLNNIRQLSAAARRTVRAHTPPPSETLLQRLQQLSSPEAPSVPAAPSFRPRALPALWFVLPRALAAAILLAVGIWIGHLLSRPESPTVGPGPEALSADVLPASVVAQAEEIHGFCSRLAEGLHSGGYPADIAPVAASVERDLHSVHPYPDLRSIGYRYRGAGPCGKPLPDTAHLLYRSLVPGSVKAVSVFVQAWHDQYPLKPGRLYTVSVATSPFPMLAWRTDRVVYFLLADDTATEQAAASLIRGEGATRPATADR